MLEEVAICRYHMPAMLIFIRGATQFLKPEMDWFSSLPNDHPLHVAIRTYPLALSLSLGPALLSFTSSRRARSDGLILILRRELSTTAFPFAITVALAGGSALRTLWKRLDQRQIKAARGSESDAATRPQDRLKSWQKSFICNALASFVAFSLLQRRRRSTHARNLHIPMTVPISQAHKAGPGRMSATLDLTLLVLVRACDALVQGLVFRRTGNEKKQERKRRLAITTKLDALAFWASSAGSAFLPFFRELPLTDVDRRIMWCFFYEPKRCVFIRSSHVWCERTSDSSRTGCPLPM